MALHWLLVSPTGKRACSHAACLELSGKELKGTKCPGRAVSHGCYCKSRFFSCPLSFLLLFPVSLAPPSGASCFRGDGTSGRNITCKRPNWLHAETGQLLRIRKCVAEFPPVDSHHVQSDTVDNTVRGDRDTCLSKGTPEAQNTATPNIVTLRNVNSRRRRPGHDELTSRVETRLPDSRSPLTDRHLIINRVKHPGIRCASLVSLGSKGISRNEIRSLRLRTGWATRGLPITLEHAFRVKTTKKKVCVT